MSRTRLRAGLAVALLLTVGAAWYAPAEEAQDGVSESVSAPAAPRGMRQEVVAPLDVLAIRPRGDDGGASEAGLFAPVEWEPAAVAEPEKAAAPVTAEPAAPQAPPLAFRVIGSYEQAGQTIVFLQQNERNHVVRVGDTIDDTYKVEAIEGTSMTLRYLPLDQVQNLELGRTLKEK